MSRWKTSYADPLCGEPPAESGVDWRVYAKHQETVVTKLELVLADTQKFARDLQGELAASRVACEGAVAASRLKDAHIALLTEKVARLCGTPAVGPASGSYADFSARTMGDALFAASRAEHRGGLPLL